MHYLPHIAGITLHVHPLLKSLYRMCEELSLVQSGRLLLDVREKVESQQAGDPLRFYDPAYLEIFLLDWLTRRSIKLGDINAAGSDVQLLVGHLKSNGLQAQANSARRQGSSTQQEGGEAEEAGSRQTYGRGR